MCLINLNCFFNKNILFFYYYISIFRTGRDFFIDGTFDAAPKFGGQCKQLFVIMGISYDVVSGFYINFFLNLND